MILFTSEHGGNFSLMLVIFPIIFGFYVLWELSRLIEKRKKNGPKSRIEWNIIFFFFLFNTIVVRNHLTGIFCQICNIYLNYCV